MEGDPAMGWLALVTMMVADILGQIAISPSASSMVICFTSIKQTVFYVWKLTLYIQHFPVTLKFVRRFNHTDHYLLYR